MATKTYDEASGYTFQWKIENISHSWMEKGKVIDSPKFIYDDLGGTKWFLRLYPSGNSSENFFGFYLRRAIDCDGPNFVEINYLLSILDKDGSILKERMDSKRNYDKNRSFGFDRYEEREKIFLVQREAFLPEDTLTVQCTIWKTEEKSVIPIHLCAKTVFQLNRRSFIWRIDKFSAVRCGLKNKFKDAFIEFDLIFNEGLDLEKKLAIVINSFNESVKYFSFRISTVNSEGKRENCVTHEYFVDDLKRGGSNTLLFTKTLMENKSRYFPNDVLSLDCEYVSSNGNVSYEHCNYGIISSKFTKEEVEIRDEHNNGKEKSKNTLAMANDLKSMYLDRIFSDMELRTSTQTFPAHKNILSARSPVFRKMFNTDMKENNSGHVDITDLEDETVQRMLLYIYTDNLDDLQFEIAYKLYVAADKYEILTLRSTCSSFLKDNLCPANACDVLILADRHQDDEFKSYVQDFILKYDKEVLGSLEWKHFMTQNLPLAADIMYRFTQCKIHKT